MTTLKPRHFQLPEEPKDTNVDRRAFLKTTAATLSSLAFVGLASCGDDDIPCTENAECPDGEICRYTSETEGVCAPAGCGSCTGSSTSGSYCSGCTGSSTSGSYCSSCTGSSTSGGYCSSCTGSSTSGGCSSCTGSSTSGGCSSCSSSCKHSCHGACSGTCSGGCKNMTF